MGGQLLSGEDIGDATIKTLAHAGIGIAIGMSTLAFWPGVVVGLVATTVFDYVYDNWDEIKEYTAEKVDDIVDGAKDLYKSGKKAVDNGIKEVKKTLDNVGDAVSGFMNNLGSVFS